ncbi:MAG: tRNA (adenosine(37)-N6)-threonylcarbamoyltransferase complex ATPase subunit type 1 TsaE, partial [Gemmatimonadaceae bacterium]|nr:tRNA (adenosine(37)-N6)-threonylcarbamoyltransferase complex ATPase subunit type 1 TsaE [Gemmatimonadaceae bacterium]
MTEGELRDWGRRFGRSAHAPLLVTIAGELGAGKTTLVQALCAGYGVYVEVTSPTFA